MVMFRHINQKNKNMDSNVKTQVIQRVKEAQNILVTVSDNPSVDQLAAVTGFTLFLNKIKKKATAVFSGTIPSTLEFLKPEETIEANTDSLRDFIVSLDKSKADKLKYKVEDDVVKIFITPYKTSISEDDLTYSQGDFNVDVVIALGVEERDHIDKAIIAHGRILHDATVIGLMAGDNKVDVGGMNWQEADASSLCEMIVDLSNELEKDSIDKQIATAYLTGIVSETERFSNNKTTPKVMSISADLMSRGANNQLISDELAAEEIEETISELPEPVEEQFEDTIDENGVLTVSHPLVDDLKETDDLEGLGSDVAFDAESDLTQAEDISSVVDNVQSAAQKSDLELENVDQPAEEDQFAKYLTDSPTLPDAALNSNLSASDEDNESKISPLSEVQEDNTQNSNIEVVSTEQMLEHNDTSLNPDSSQDTDEQSTDIDDQVLTYEMTEKGVVNPIETVDHPAEGTVPKPDPETARRLVEEAVEKNYDEGRPEARKDLGATELANSLSISPESIIHNYPEPQEMVTTPQNTNVSQMPGDEVSPVVNNLDVPPEAPPPFPFPSPEEKNSQV